MKHYFPYDPDNPQVVTGERHEIDKGVIRLFHIPKVGSLTIDGFTETDNPLNIQSNQFFCYYAADRLYREANRLVYFNRGLHGQRVTCSYLAIGTPVTADDMNEIKDFMDNGGGGTDSQLVNKVTQLGNDILDVRNEARQNLSDHNQNIAAHNDIRNEIAKLKVNQELVDKVDALSSAVACLEDVDDNIFSILGALSSADDDLSDAIYQLNQHADAVDETLTKLNETTLGLSDAIFSVDAKLDDTFAILNETLSGLSSTLNSRITELSYNLDDLAQDIDDETRLRKSADREINKRIDALSLSVADTAQLDAKIAALSAAIGNNIGDKIAGLSSNLVDESIARINADNELFDRISGLSSTVHDILNRIDGETPADPTTNEIIFSNKPHAGYNSLGKADFLTYVFGAQTPAAYSASGASAFLDYIF